MEHVYASISFPLFRAHFSFMEPLAAISEITGPAIAAWGDTGGSASIGGIGLEWALIGFLLSLSLLHLLIFSYHPKKKSNLFFSLLSFFLAANRVVFVYQTYHLAGPHEQVLLEALNQILNVLSMLSGVYFIYFIVFDRLDRRLLLLVGAGAIFVAGLALWPDSRLLLRTVPVYRLASYSLMIFWLLRAMWRQEPEGVRLVGLGSFLLMLTMLLFRFDVFSLWNGYPLSRVLLTNLGYLLAHVFYSVYLARDLARTSRSLALQLRQVKVLSEENRQKEQVNKELLERQKNELEVLVQIRTEELIHKNEVLEEQKQEISSQKEKLQELDTLKSRFFANISHEFRTPLTLILAPIKKHLELARKPEDKMEFSVMHRSASHLLNLVNQLLDLSRVEAGTLKLKAVEGEMVSFTAAIVSQFRSLAESRQIDFQFRAQGEIRVWFDPEKLEKILYNLLVNAFKFTSPPGRVVVSVEGQEPSAAFPEGAVQLRVQDTGIGISPEHQEKIFERFYQVDNSLQREYEGTGIGLSLSRELVELHHGEIGLASEPGEGTVFWVNLPLGAAHLSPEEMGGVTGLAELLADRPKVALTAELELAPEPETGAAPAESILLVEDNADLRDFLRLNLHPRYKVLTAANGEEGLEVARREIPDLIISDLMMPVMDGMELCHRLKNDERTSHIPVILLTAKADAASKMQGYETGADAYMPKPFDLKELLVRVRNLVDNRKKLRETYTRQMTLRPSEVTVVSADDRFLQKCLAVVEEHLADGAFGVEPFAREIGMSTVQLYRKVRALTGYTPNEFIRSMRLQRAHDLLAQRVGNVAEVAYDTGFSNLSYFAKCFREKYGQSPSEFLHQQPVGEGRSAPAGR